MRKTILSLLLGVLLLLTHSSLTFAQADTTANKYGYKITQDEFDEYNAAVQSCDTPSLECLVRYTTRFIAMEWVNDIKGTGESKLEDIEGVPTSMSQPNGIVGGVFTLISGMYSYRPANTGRYVADVMDSAGFATPAYAQGLGFASLDPILGLWKMFRNVAYFFFIVIFIVIGFMIMFRAKIGSQAVVTAQQAIPSVIISLILVTFSYAIAGFMIDLMYLVMFMMVGLFQGLSGVGGEGTVQSSDLINFNIVNLTSFLFWNSVGNNSQNVAITDTFLTAAGAPSFVNWVGSFLGGLTLTIVITIATLIGCIKLFFELLKSYAAIVLSVVLGPLALMMGAMPGQNVFWPWFKGIVGNLLAFPTVLLLIIMFIEFTEGGESITTTGGFMPPFLLGAGQSGIIGPLMGLAIILAMPEIVKKVKDATGASDGGFTAMVAGAAFGRAKEAWGGKMPMGMNGRNILRAGAIGAGAVGLGTGVGLGAAGYALAKGKNPWKYAAGGAAAGFGAPIAVATAPSVVRTANRVGGTFRNLATTGLTVASALPFIESRLGESRMNWLNDAAHGRDPRGRRATGGGTGTTAGGGTPTPGPVPVGSGTIPGAGDDDA